VAAVAALFPAYGVTSSRRQGLCQPGNVNAACAKSTMLHALNRYIEAQAISTLAKGDPCS
jgi:hypothetical protein